MRVQFNILLHLQTGTEVKMIYGVLAAIFVLVLVVACTSNRSQPVSDDYKAYQELALLLSRGDDLVIEEINFYLTDADKYYKKNEHELYQRGIEDASTLTPTIVLVDSLYKHKKLVYLDGSSEPAGALSQLDNLSAGKLKESECYEPLYDFYKSTKYGFGTFLGQDGDWPSIFECVKQSDLNIIAINEGSDALALILINTIDLEVVVSLAKRAKIKLYFDRK